MKPLHEWSGRRVAAVALVWVLGLPLLAAPALFGAVGWLARAERERAAAVPDSVAPALRVNYGTPEAGDALISLAAPEIIAILAVLLLPPLALCVTWLVVRTKRADQVA